MNNRLLAQQLLIVTVGAGATAYVDYTPAVGEAVEIINAYGYHDEGAALNCLWALNTSGGMRDMTASASIASAAFDFFYPRTGIPTHKTLILRWGQTLRWATLAKTAGKIAVMVLLVDKYKGETPYDG